MSDKPEKSDMDFPDIESEEEIVQQIEAKAFKQFKIELGLDQARHKNAIWHHIASSRDVMLQKADFNDRFKPTAQIATMMGMKKGSHDVSFEYREPGNSKPVIKTKRFRVTIV